MDGLCRVNEDCVEGETVVAGNGRKPNKLLGGISFARRVDGGEWRK